MSDQGGGPEGASGSGERPGRWGWRGWGQLALVAAAVGVAWYFARAPAGGPLADDALGDAPRPAPVVQVVRPTAQQAARQVSATGVVSVVGGVALHSQVAGEVVFVSPALRPGAALVAGQTLLRIDRQDFEIRLAGAQAQLRHARAELEKEQLKGQAHQQRYLRENPGAAVPAIVARLPQIAREEAAVERAELLVEKAELELSRTTVSAPFDGWVRTSRLQAGQVVRPLERLAQLFAKDAVQVEARLSQAEMAALGECARPNLAAGPPSGDLVGCRTPPVIGHAAQVEADGHLFDAVVERVSAVVDLESRLATLYMRFADGVAVDAMPRPGTFATVTLDGPLLSSVFVLPERAQRDDGSIWIVVDGILESLTPRGLGRSDAGWLVAPFDAGEGVVVGAVASAREGLPVVASAVGDGS